MYKFNISETKNLFACCLAFLDNNRLDIKPNLSLVQPSRLNLKIWLMAKTFLMLTGCEQIENPFPANQTIGSI